MIVQESAYAKLNLFLHIIGINKKGYHLLESLVIFLPLTDVLSLSIEIPPLYSPHSSKVTIVGEYSIQDTLCLKTLEYLKWSTNIQLYKNIPIGAGLGGGSADVGALLRLAKTFYKKELSINTMVNIGADVPMCYESVSSLVEGIGEIVTPVSIPLNRGLLLIKPPYSFSTQAIFHAYRMYHEAYHSSLFEKFQKKDVFNFFKKRDIFLFLKQETSNDLFPFVLKLYPQYKEVVDIVKSTHPNLVRMTGSGSALFALYENVDIANQAKLYIQKQNEDLWIYGGVSVGSDLT